MRLKRETEQKIKIIEAEIRSLEQIKRMCEDNHYMNEKIKKRLERIPLLKQLLSYNLDKLRRIDEILDIA